MRIKCYPYQTVIDTEQVTVYKVAVIGHVLGTQYIEREVGIVSNPDLAPHLVGEWIKHSLNEHKVAALVEKGYTENDAIKLVEQHPPKYPEIPGVTVKLDIKWQNVKFSDKEKHRRQNRGKQDVKV